LDFLSIPDHAGDQSPRRLAPETIGLAAEIRETAFSLAVSRGFVAIWKHVSAAGTNVPLQVGSWSGVHNGAGWKGQARNSLQ
jgi:hypothetical protein